MHGLQGDRQRRRFSSKLMGLLEFFVARAGVGDRIIGDGVGGPNT